MPTLPFLDRQTDREIDVVHHKELFWHWQNKVQKKNSRMMERGSVAQCQKFTSAPYLSLSGSFWHAGSHRLPFFHQHAHTQSHLRHQTREPRTLFPLTATPPLFPVLRPASLSDRKRKMDPTTHPVFSQACCWPTPHITALAPFGLSLTE